MEGKNISPEKSELCVCFHHIFKWHMALHLGLFKPGLGNVWPVKSFDLTLPKQLQAGLQIILQVFCSLQHKI